MAMTCSVFKTAEVFHPIYESLVELAQGGYGGEAKPREATQVFYIYYSDMERSFFLMLYATNHKHIRRRMICMHLLDNK